MGLPSVLKEVERLNGRISVSSKAGGGTEFTIILPICKTPELVKVTIDDIMTPLMNTIIGLVESQLCEAGSSSIGMNAEKTDRMVLKKYTAFTDIKGALEGRLALSFDGDLARRFASGFSVDGLPEGDDTGAIEDSISECLNIILGNSIKMFPGLEELVLYNSPVTISSEGTIIKYPESDVWTCSIKFDFGSMSLNFAVPRGMLR
jgi:two-component system chemotaxis sensor kinase CheA